MFDLNRYTEEEREHFKKMRVVVLSPVMYDYPKFWRSLVNMIPFSQFMGLRIDEMAMTERTVVDWARNDLAEQAMEAKSPIDDKPYTHFLWLDCDEIFKVDLACQLARHDVDMVSALYYSRLAPHKPLVYLNAHDPKDEYKHYPLLEIPAALVQVDAFGFGACLMKREVLEKIPQPWFTLDWRGGEDITFCTRAKQHGIKLYCDGAYSVAHIGMNKLVTTADYQQWYQDNLEEIEANREEIQLQGKE
jgi:hypothetical protein